MNPHDIGLSIVAFFSEVFGTISGFGSSTFFVPIGLFFESMHFVLAITAILHCFSNFSKITLFKSHFSWKLFWKLALPSIVFTGVGALLSNLFSVEHLIHALGVFLILISVLFVLSKKYIHKLPFGVGIGLSTLSGFFTGFVGTGGALRGLALNAMNLNKYQFVVISSSIDMGGDLLRAAIYIKNGYMDWDQWFYIPLFAIAAVLGAWVGRKILHHIDQVLFEKIVTVMVFLSGVAMLFR